jgi:hypothetical protein
VPGQEMLVRRKMIKKILDIFERDFDVTYADEFHYIYITIKETISILRNGNHL